MVEVAFERYQLQLNLVNTDTEEDVNADSVRINPFTAKLSQKQISTKFPNFILLNFEK